MGRVGDLAAGKEWFETMSPVDTRCKASSRFRNEKGRACGDQVCYQQSRKGNRRSHGLSSCEVLSIDTKQLYPSTYFWVVVPMISFFETDESDEKDDASNPEPQWTLHA